MDTLALTGPIHLTLQSTGAEVLGREEDDNPVFTRTTYRDGALYFLSYPLETALSSTPGAFHTGGAQPYWRIYAHIAQAQIAGRVVRKDHPMVGVTEHPETQDRRIVVLINYSPEPVETVLSLAADWAVLEPLVGQAPLAGGTTLRLSPHDAVVLRVGR